MNNCRADINIAIVLTLLQILWKLYRSIVNVTTNGDVDEDDDDDGDDDDDDNNAVTAVATHDYWKEDDEIWRRNSDDR